MIHAGYPQQGFWIGLCIGALPPLLIWLYYMCRPLTNTLADIALALVKTLGLALALLSGLICGLVGLAVGVAYQRLGSNGWLFGAALVGIALAAVIEVVSLGYVIRYWWNSKQPKP